MATAREHLDWCVQRAMEYANRGDMPQAWASFGSDVLNHEGTRHIAGHELFGMAMFSLQGVFDSHEQRETVFAELLARRLDS